MIVDCGFLVLERFDLILEDVREIWIDSLDTLQNRLELGAVVLLALHTIGSQKVKEPVAFPDMMYSQQLYSYLCHHLG